MFNINIQTHLQTIAQFFHANPHVAGIITFFVVFAEAMAVIGVIVPGTVTMSAIGILVGTETIPIGSTFMWAILGAICGDYLSYIIGTYYQAKLHKIWPFKKHEQWLLKSEKFFKKHGGKSIIIGRFIGPMRAMVPMVAGMFKMPQGRFLLAAIPSASIWAIIYLFPGILLGALSQELPPKKATEFIAIALALLVIMWLATWFIQLFAKKIYKLFDLAIIKIWKFLNTHKTLNWIPKLLKDPREPNHHQQLSLLIIALLLFSLFLILFINVFHQGFLTSLNEPLYYFFSSLRTPTIDCFITSITLIGKSKIILSAAGLFLLWLSYKRYWYIAFHWLILIILSTGFIATMKTLFYNPRPPGILDVLHTSSFPSGHTFFAVSFFGFFAVIAARELSPTKRFIPYTIASLLVGLVAFSRIFLGAHWLTDVTASILSGTSIVLLLTIAYRRRHFTNFSLKQLSMIFTGIFFAVWFIGNIALLQTQTKLYTLRWQPLTISLHQWQNQKSSNIPLYRSNRIGTPIQAFNIEWKGDLVKIKKTLLKQNWQEQDVKLDLRGILQRLIGDSVVSHLPLLPQLYQNKSPVLLLTKTLNQNKNILILRLWQSNITIKNGTKELWLGVVSYSTQKKWLHKNKKFFGATDELTRYLSTYNWKQITHPLYKQPEEMQDLQWDGKVLLIWGKKHEH